MYYSTTLFVVLLTLLKSSTPTLTPVDPPISVDSLPLLPSSGGTCGDAKESYQQQQCCGAAESKVTNIAASYVPDPHSRFALSDAQTTSCDLPTFCQCQFPVNASAFLAARADAKNGLLAGELINRWISNVGVSRGTKLLSGSSYSSHAIDGTRYDPSNASSVPRNYYIHEMFVSSKAMFHFWNWLAKNYDKHQLRVDGQKSRGLSATELNDASTRLVFAGVCKHYADKIQKVFAETELGRAYGTAIDFALPASSMIARPMVGLGAGVKTIELRTERDVDANGLRPTGWEV